MEVLACFGSEEIAHLQGDRMRFCISLVICVDRRNLRMQMSFEVDKFTPSRRNAEVVAVTNAARPAVAPYLKA